MAHFAPVAPIQVLEAMYSDSPDTFGRYHLLLAHHTVEYETRFRALFSRIASDDIIAPYVIMDNSVVECGGSVDFGMMMRATAAIADHCDAVFPVLPDVMGDGEATRAAVQECYSTWDKTMPGAGFMAVCQGKNWDDYEASLALFASPEFETIEILGIPRILVKTLKTRELAVYRATRSKRPQQYIHLLGYSDDMIDDVYCSKLEGVHGIDSAVPLRYEDDFTFKVDPGPRPESWMETAEFTQLMHSNLNFARHTHQ